MHGSKRNGCATTRIALILYSIPVLHTRSYWQDRTWGKGMVGKGVRQWSHFSPYLYNLRAEDIAQKPGLDSDGVKTGERSISNSGDAGDTKFLAENNNSQKTTEDDFFKRSTTMIATEHEKDKNHDDLKTIT